MDDEWEYEREACIICGYDMAECYPPHNFLTSDRTLHWTPYGECVCSHCANKVKSPEERKFIDYNVIIINNRWLHPHL